VTKRPPCTDCPAAVVGGAGFLGSHLVDHLIKDRNCDVLVVDNLCAGRREFIHPDAHFIHHEITGSEEYLRAAFSAHQPRYVFNYAAYPYVPDSFDRPVHVGNVNYLGAMKVINAAQEAGVEAILQVSSAEVYGHRPEDRGTVRVEYPAGANAKISEQTPIAPHSSYGVAKAAVDAAVQVRWREAGTPCIALRQFNCVGERETHPYVVPEIISQLHTSKVREKRSMWPRKVKLGNNAARDFLYAGDAVRAAAELAERGEFGEVYNLGSEEAIKVYDLVPMVGEVMGLKAEAEYDPARVRPWEIWHLCSSNEKINGVIEYRPGVPLKEALKRAVAWFYGDDRGKWPWEG
jgi:nucleoside-diphosphate-sugar epimerase